MIIEDFVKPYYKTASSRFIKILGPVLTLVLGAIVIVFAFLSQNIDAIVQICQSINGIVGGPTVGVFTLGLLMPYVSEMPAVGTEFFRRKLPSSKNFSVENQKIENDLVEGHFRRNFFRRKFTFAQSFFDY